MPQPIQFGTDGWRAVIADGFTFENVSVVVRAIAQYLQATHGQCTQKKPSQKPVVIGFDTRFLANRFASYAAGLLAQQGFKVLLTEAFTPTPIVAFAAQDYDTLGALMFTASHNPPEYCGIKFIPEYAGPATAQITNQILSHLAEIQAQNATGTPSGLDLRVPDPHDHAALHTNITLFNPTERYLALISSQIDFKAIAQKPLKILHDPMYGAGQACLQSFFQQKAGYSLQVMHNQRDPLFGGNLPEPKAEYLTELMQAVPAQGYDLGIANDGDADRIGLVDETGRFYGTNEIIPLLLWYLHTQKGFKGSVVRTVATTSLVDKLAELYGLTLHETPVGFKYVGEWMRQESVIVGGEESGGVSFLGHIPEKDGLMASLMVVEMMATQKKPLSQLYAELLERAGLTLYGISINLHLPDEAKKGLMEAMRALQPGQVFAGRPITRLNTLDGVKVFFAENDWLLVRPSGTEPILRLYGESPDPQNPPRFEQAVQALIDQVNQASSSVVTLV